jgi:hypothetical protein
MVEWHQQIKYNKTVFALSINTSWLSEKQQIPILYSIWFDPTAARIHDSEWVSDCCLTPIQQFFSYIMVTLQWDDDEVRFVLDQHTELDFIVLVHWSNSPRVDMSLGHIILIPSQPVIAFSPECDVLSGEATNTNVIVFGVIITI